MTETKIDREALERNIRNYLNRACMDVTKLSACTYKELEALKAILLPFKKDPKRAPKTT